MSVAIQSAPPSKAESIGMVTPASKGDWAWLKLLSCRQDLLAVLLCTVTGGLLSVLPHLLWWHRVGAPVWIADNDELLYLSYAGRAYRSHPFHLEDPVPAGGGSSIYP